MNAIRLLIFNDFPFIGCAEQIVLTLCRYIRSRPADRQWQIHVVTSHSGPFASAALAIDSVSLHYIDIQGLKSHWMSPFAWLKIRQQITRLVDTLAPNIILCNSLWSAIVVSRAGVHAQTPLAGVIHADVSPKRRLKKFIFNLFGYFFVRGIKMWITVAAELKSQLMAIGVPEESIRIIPNGVVIPESDAVIRDGAWRRRFKIPADAVVVATLGRLDPGKGPHVLIDAMSELLASGIDGYLIITGEEARSVSRLESELIAEGVYTRILHKMIVASGLENRVFLTGFVDDVFSVIQECDIVASASRAESFGLAVLEGMAAGRPVVASNVAGHRKLVTHGTDGFLVACDDTSGFVEALRNLIEDATLREKMGHAGRANAGAWDVETSMSRWLGKLDETVQRRCDNSSILSEINP